MVITVCVCSCGPQTGRTGSELPCYGVCQFPSSSDELFYPRCWPSDRPPARGRASLSLTCIAQRDGPHLPRTNSTSSLGIYGMSPSVSCSVDCSLDSGRLVISPPTACHVRDNGGGSRRGCCCRLVPGHPQRTKGPAKPSRAAEGQCAGGDGSTKAPLFLRRGVLWYIALALCGQCKG